MDRLACVNVIDLPMQLLLHRHPGWQHAPVVVVDRDQPNGVVTWANKYARRSRISPGMRYGEALSLEHDLRAATVTETELADSIETIAGRLIDYAPVVEAGREQPGIFWLGVHGLDRLFGSFERWAQTVAGELLDEDGLYTTVIVGFSRFGTWAVARAVRGDVVVLDDPEQETRWMRRVPLAALHVDARMGGRFRDGLHKLGIDRIGQFLQLPPGGVHRRFGEEALTLYRRVRGDLQMPLTPFEPRETPREHLDLEAPETVSSKLIFGVKRYLHPLLNELERRQDALARLQVVFRYERGGHERFEVRPASPTTDEQHLVDLLRLRLETLDVSAGVVHIELNADTRRANREQMSLFVGDERDRDLDDADRALARVRAEFGDDSVVYARLEDGHLPEARFGWEPLEHLEEAEPRPVDVRPLIRRIRRRPQPVPPGRLDLDRRSPADATNPTSRAGPFVVSGGWWAGQVHRQYHFVEADDGELMWVFWDDCRKRWFRHGRLE